MAERKDCAARRFIGSIHVEAENERALEIVEVGDFTQDALDILGEDSLDELRLEVATLRQLGEVVKDTGGLRKMRWSARGKGKRGGARILYYYGNDDMPVFLVAIYPKSSKADMTAAEKKAARKFIAEVKREYSVKHLKTLARRGVEWR